MTTYTSRTDIMVQGKVESSAQGKLIGAVDTMPAAKDYTDGVVVLFTGTTTDTYVKGRYYRSNGIAWSEADFNLVVDSAPTSGSGNPVSSDGVYDALAGKQDNLVFDTTPKSGSLNPVTSGGLYTAFSNKLDKTGTAARAIADASGNDITTTYATKTEVNAKQDALSFDAAPTSNSANPVTSNGIYEALANKVDVVSGKGLSTNDYTTAEKNKLAGIATGAQVNVIESVKVNGTALTPSDRAVNIDLSNYATKGDVSAIPKFAVTVVASLPTSDISASTIYLVSNSGSGTNAYDEYIYVNGGWEKIGTTATDLSDYVTTTALNSALAGKQDKLTTGTGISLSGSAISLATSGVTAGSQGSATTIPIINVDAYGRVTSLSSTTVYPPTTPGTSGQYWTSDGNGAGVWTSPSTAPSSGSPNLITSGAVHTALAGKQNNLTFDFAPVENSSNPVTSGGLYTMKANLEQAIADAEVNITGAATTIVTNNLLASRALVSNADGKVAVSDVTSTELGYLDGVTSNVQTQLDSKISSIPSAGSSTQPIYINSSGVPTKCNYSLGAAAAKAVTTSVTDGSTSLVTSGGVYTAVAAKQDKLTFDSTPTSGSSNPVTSGGVFSAINTGVPASGTYDADTSTITFKAASGTQLFQVTGIEGGGVSFTLKVTYTGAPDVSGISVTATPLIGATATVQGTTNSSGVAYLSVKQNATYKITSSKTGYTFTSSPEVTCEDLTTETSISCYVPGTVTITVTDEKASVVGRTVTATASGQTTQTKTVASGQTSVTFSLPAATWTFTTDYPSGATGATSITQVIENNGVYSGTISIVYNIVFGFQIAIGTSYPLSRVTYPATIFGQTNKAYGKTPASGTGANCMNSWDGCPLISGIKRQRGNSTDGWTDVTDTTKWESGNHISGYDVMTYIPTWYMKMTNDGTNIDCAFSEKKIDDTWIDYAGSVGSNRVGHFRVGCFAGYVSSSRLYSEGSITPTTNISITNFITYAKARGTGYDIMTWYQWAYLTALAVLLYKSTDLQTAMAGGYVGGSAVQTQSSLTWSNAYGMAGTASTSSTAQMSFFWIQNLWGNIYQFVGGAKTDSNCRLMTCTGYSSVTDSDFDKTALTATLSPGSVNGYLSKVSGTTDTGFFPQESSGSGTTYFADSGYVIASSFPIVGGDYYSGDVAGPFSAYFNYSATHADSNVGSRLSYRL